MAKANKKDASTMSKPRRKRPLQSSASRPSKETASTSKAAIATGKGKEVALGFKEARLITQSKTSGPSASTPRAAPSPSSPIPRKVPDTQILSDEDHDGSNSSVEGTVESDSEDPDRQLGLRRDLRVVSKATIRKTWKPITMRSRTHMQGVITNLFPAVISRARGEKRKIAVQITLNRLMQRMNDRLCALDVPPSNQGASYSQLSARNKTLESMLVPDLEHIRDLELRLEQEQILAKQDEEELESFREKKQGLDSRTHQLYRSKLHPELRDRKLAKTMTSLCAADNDFSHLSAVDQRLMNLLSASRDEDFTGADIRDGSYNPDQDVGINKISKRLGTRLLSIEQNNDELDPLLQLVATAQSKIRELSNSR